MFIQTNESSEIIQLITVGDKPLENGYEIENIEEEVLENIFDYKYIDGNFVLKDNIVQEKLEKVKKTKIKKMSSICNKTIVSGITLNSEDYSLETNDQLTILALKQIAESGNIVKYHANGKECRIYEPEEFLILANTALSYIDFHRTYFNKLKSDINDMVDINKVINVQYGQSLSEQRQSEFKALMGDIIFEFKNIIDNTNYQHMIHDINIDELVFSKDIEQYDEINGEI